MLTATRFSLFFFLIYQINLPAPSYAGIFKDETSLIFSKNKAENLKEQVLPGKIVVSDSDGMIWSDFMSATPIGKPEDTQTKTILSCAHNFLLWDTHNDWKKSTKAKMYYCDSFGKQHKIIDAVTLSSDNMDAINDIAVYYLEDNVPCNPRNTIDRELSKDLDLSSLSYGWELVSSDVPLVRNFLGEDPHCLQNNLYLNQNNLYAHVYTVDRMLHLSNRYNEHRYSYLASSTNPSIHQTYMHDSGSSWFKENNTNGYSLTALASEEQAVTDDIIKAMDKQNNILGEAHFLDSFFTMKVHKLTKRRFAVNLFTPLAPHREWIYRQVR